VAYTNPNIATSGATFANLQAGGLSNLLERLITVNGAATAAPTAAPTLAESGSGGTLPAATYYVVVTETNGVGETTASPASTGQAITLGEDLVVTFPTLKTGNTARNTYVGTASTGPFTLAATGTTAATLTISAPLPSGSYAVGPPTMNSTGFTSVDANGITLNFVESNIRAAERGNLQDVYRNAAQTLDAWLRGDPVSSAGIIAKMHHAHTAFAVITQAFADAGTLIDANAGSFHSSTSGGVGTVSSTVRTWP